MMKESSFQILQFVRFMVLFIFAIIPSTTYAASSPLEITSTIRSIDLFKVLRGKNSRRNNRSIGRNIIINNSPISNIKNNDDEESSSKNDWKFWENLKSKRETRKEDEDDEDTNKKGGDGEKKSTTTRKRRWGDIRKPSSSSSETDNNKANIRNKKKKKAAAKKDDDNGGDDIVYGPSKKEKKARKVEEKRKKAQQKQEEEEVQKENDKNVQTTRLSLFERKRASRQQKKNEKEEDEAKQHSKKDEAETLEETTKNEDIDTDRVVNDDGEGDSSDSKKDNSTQPTKLEQEKNQTESVEKSPEGRKSTYVLVGSPSSYGSPYSRPAQFRSSPGGVGTPQQPQNQNPNTATVIASAVVIIVQSVYKLWGAQWLARRFHFGDEMKKPRQHFFWECLNDRYTKDDAVLKKAIATPAVGFTKLKWGRYLKSRRDNGGGKKEVPSKTVIVADITPEGFLDVGYLTDIVSFLIGVQRRGIIGEESEIILLVHSPGGPATTFGLAAAQVARLEQMAGVNVTVCVDAVAASGGYMIASQSSQIVAAPFAMVGSIGVFSEGLNFNKLLTDNGIKPLVIKSGESKNRLSAIGFVSDDDIKSEKERSEEVHKAFIELCANKRPDLDLSICNGVVLMGSVGKNCGLVDRVLTSSEYIWEKICDGDHVLKLHRSNKDSGEMNYWATVINLLPHLKHQVTKQATKLPLGTLLQGYALLTMVLGVVKKHLD